MRTSIHRRGMATCASRLLHLAWHRPPLPCCRAGRAVLIPPPAFVVEDRIRTGGLASLAPAHQTAYPVQGGVGWSGMGWGWGSREGSHGGGGGLRCAREWQGVVARRGVGPCTATPVTTFFTAERPTLTTHHQPPVIPQGPTPHARSHLLPQPALCTTTRDTHSLNNSENSPP